MKTVFKESTEYPDEWTCKTKIKNQTVQVSFQPDYKKGKGYWNIALSIYNKRRQEIDNFDAVKNTGNIGLAGLLFARQAVKDFEQIINDEYKTFNKSWRFFLYCSWLDNRRRDIYYRGLKDLGYKFSQYEGKKVLMKEI